MITSETKHMEIIRYMITEGALVTPNHTIVTDNIDAMCDLWNGEYVALYTGGPFGEHILFGITNKAIEVYVAIEGSNNEPV